jgi:F-type H+-transporting ATPase subunit delta
LADDISATGSIVSGLAGRYASALFELAEDAGQVDAVGRGLKAFDAMIEGSEDLARLVRNPVFTADQQLAAVSTLMDKAGIGGLAGNFIRLLATKRRLFAFRDMVRAYQAIADAKAGVVRAEVTVAETLSDKNRKSVQDALRAVTGKSVEIAERVDPSIIGGLIVKLGSRMVDSSLRTKLNSLKIAMKEVG